MTNNVLHFHATFEQYFKQTQHITNQINKTILELQAISYRCHQGRHTALIG